MYDLTLTITGITNANPAVLTYTGTDPVNGQEVYISGITGAIGTYLNGRNFKIANVNGGANTFELQYMDGTNVNSTSMGSWTSGGTAKRVYTVTTNVTYLEADLFDLNFVQSADVITIVHPSYPPKDLTRTGDTSWTLTTTTFAPAIAAPTGVAVSGAAGTVAYWVVTSVADDTFEESLASSAVGGSTDATVGSPRTISWTVAAGAQSYNIYKALNGVYGFIGVASGTSFIDKGVEPDYADTPPAANNPFGSADNYPSTVTYFQQRQAYANTNNDPEKVFISRTANFHNFTSSAPVRDDDSISFTMSGRQVNSVTHLLDLGRLIVLTSGGEWAAEGSNGVLTPSDINLKQYSYNGSSNIEPLVIGSNALFVQARGSAVRDLAFDYQVDGYRGNDLTIFAAHLLDNYTIIDWTYQQIPHSIVWAVRSDGVLLGLTYVQEQQVLAWHRHDFDGLVESITCVPEGTEDAVYVVVKRTIGGVSKRYIERMTERRITGSIVDMVLVESNLSYDGRNTGSTSMTLSGGTTWVYSETLTLTSSSAYFTAADVGNQIQLTGSDGTLIRCTITAYTSTTVVSVRPHKTVPVVMRSTAITDWARAVDVVSGLWHLEGETVSVFADGFVVANPNNAAYVVLTVTNGSITLDKPYSVIHVGRPYTSDIETLNIDNANSESLVDKYKNVGKVTIQVESSRGIWVGAAPPTDDATDPLEGLEELKIRNAESYESPVDLKTDSVSVIIRPEWNSNGRVFVRQVDPVPLSVLSIAPAGDFPFRGGA
jgi:hypothetical protein